MNITVEKAKEIFAEANKLYCDGGDPNDLVDLVLRLLDINITAKVI